MPRRPCVRRGKRNLDIFPVLKGEGLRNKMVEKKGGKVPLFSRTTPACGIRCLRLGRTARPDSLTRYWQPFQTTGVLVARFRCAGLLDSPLPTGQERIVFFRIARRIFLHRGRGWHPLIFCLGLSSSLKPSSRPYRPNSRRIPFRTGLCIRTAG